MRGCKLKRGESLFLDLILGLKEFDIIGAKELPGVDLFFLSLKFTRFMRQGRRLSSPVLKAGRVRYAGKLIRTSIP
jgi:hypothetical protein